MHGNNQNQSNFYLVLLLFLSILWSLYPGEYPHLTFLLPYLWNITGKSHIFITLFKCISGKMDLLNRILNFSSVLSRFPVLEWVMVNLELFGWFTAVQVTIWKQYGQHSNTLLGKPTWNLYFLILWLIRPLVSIFN